jgi:hypothetical protein
MLNIIDGKEKETFVNKIYVTSIKYGEAEAANIIENSSLNIGIGFGPSYGILGTRAILGYNDSGLILGMGYTPNGLFSKAIGFQITVKWFFASLGTGTIGEVQYKSGEMEVIEGGFFNLGVRLNLDKSKHYCLELGLGGVSELVVNETDGPEKISKYTGSLGVSYRF